MAEWKFVKTLTIPFTLTGFFAFSNQHITIAVFGKVSK